MRGVIRYASIDPSKRGRVPRFFVTADPPRRRRSEGAAVSLVETFERTALGLPAEDGFRDLEIVRLTSVRRGRSTAFALMVDHPDGVGIDLCERIARRLDVELETATEPYTLEVESPGLDRPLVKPADYERFRDRDVVVKTTLPVAGAKTHRGRLGGIRGNLIMLHAPGGEIPIPFEIVRAANLDFDIRDDLMREKRERRKR